MPCDHRSSFNASRHGEFSRAIDPHKDIITLVRKAVLRTVFCLATYLSRLNLDAIDLKDPNRVSFESSAPRPVTLRNV